MDDVEARFGRESELRRTQMESLRWMVDLARKAGVLRIVINGSFTTDKLEPNDVDCVLLIGVSFPEDQQAETELMAGLPFVTLELADEAAFAQLTLFFSTDRDRLAKGVVEIIP